MCQRRFSLLKKLPVFSLLLVFSLGQLRGADTNAPVPVAAAQPAQNMGSNETLRAYLLLQEQLQSALLAIERTRQESQAAAAQDSIMLSNHLQAIKESLLAQRASEQESLLAQRASEMAETQRTNHLLLAIIGFFAVGGFAVALLTAYFQWRAVSRLAEISAALPAAVRALPAPASMAALGMGEHPVLSNGSVEESNHRLTGLIEHLEKRIAEIEHTAVAPLKEVLPAHNGEVSAPIAVPTSPAPNPGEKVASLLAQGQSLLQSDRPEEAIACFDEALALNSNNAEALVKKGSALEKMRQPQEALECYDRAISADRSMTIAYLHKGGLCNRLERYGEAIECYERALHSQEKKRAA